MMIQQVKAAEEAKDQAPAEMAVVKPEEICISSVTTECGEKFVCKKVYVAEVLIVSFGHITCLSTIDIYMIDFIQKHQNIKNPEIIKALEQKATNRGFKDFNTYLCETDSIKELVVYIIVKEYSLDELVKAITIVLLSGDPNLAEWYKKSWSKVIVLAGNPEKLNDSLSFKYASENIAMMGPVYQDTSSAKKLTNLIVPLTTQPLNLAQFAYLGSSSLTINFHVPKLSLGKFIVQLVHIIADLYFETKFHNGIPTITVANSTVPATYSYKYLRIDGGFTEVEPFTHTATAYII